MPAREGEASYIVVLRVFAYFAVLPLPWLVLQRQLNAYKDTLGEVTWSSAPFRLSGPQTAVILPTALFALFLAFGGTLVALEDFELIKFRNLDAQPAVVDVSSGLDRRLDSDVPVEGTSGLYTLTPQHPIWTKVPVGTLNDESDLELYGPTADTWVIVYADRHSKRSLDKIVAGRREMLAEDMEAPLFSEERRLLPDSLYPISHARYADGPAFATARDMWWVTTLVTDEFEVEVIAGTSQGWIVEEKITGLLRSLRPKPESLGP